MLKLTNLQLLTIASPVVAVLVSVSSAVPTHAAVLFDNGNPDLANAFGSDIDPTTMGFPAQSGDDFTLSSKSTLTSVAWSGVYAPNNSPQSDNFSIGIFEIVGGVPNTSPLFSFNAGSVTRTAAGTNIQAPFGYDLFNYTYSFAAPVNLNAGSYLLSIVNDTSSTQIDNWFWATSTFGTGTFFGRTGSADPWRPQASNLSFRVEGGNAAPIPTPALLPGLIGFGLGVWRKRKQASTKP